MAWKILAFVAALAWFESSAQATCVRPGPTAVPGSYQEFDVCIPQDDGQWKAVRHTCHGLYFFNEDRRKCLPYGLSIREVQLECRTPGPMCYDCRTAVMCIDKGDGEVRRIASMTCPRGTACRDGACLRDTLCNVAEFECSDDGIYPDPFDCTKYHFCMATNVHLTCSSGSYNAGTMQCDGALDSRACKEGPVPKCTQELQMGPVPGSSHLYYICTLSGGALSPDLYRCSKGQTFNNATFSCV